MRFYTNSGQNIRAKSIVIFSILLLQILSSGTLMAADFNLDSPLNKGTWRFEIDNDAIWKEDSNFTNGWSLQYHTRRYAGWDDSKAPDSIKWVGNHFPTLKGEDSIVRYGQGIGQNMFTPGDLGNPDPPEGDLPYAGTLTYTLNWQRFNRRNATNFQVTAGIMGEESRAEEFQTFAHVTLGLGTDPEGWHTQRESEPVLNLGYQYIWNLAQLGSATNDWAGVVALAPSAHLGNLFTAAELDVSFRFGWNIPEGFYTIPAPPARGFFSESTIPKPAIASPHSLETVLGGRATSLLYSVVYDGSFLTSDDRSVDREDYVFSGLIGLNYYYYKLFSVRLTFIQTTDLLNEESLPPPRPDQKQTGTDNAFGTLMIDLFY